MGMAVSCKPYLQHQVAGWLWPRGQESAGPTLDHEFHVGRTVFYSLLCFSV